MHYPPLSVLATARCGHAQPTHAWRVSAMLTLWVAMVLLALVIARSAHAEMDLLKHAKDIARVENYMSNITTLKTDFTQVAPDGGIATGIFYLQRPGKMRWQYAPPSPVLIVSDGDTLTYFDAELDQVNYVDVDDTLAGFFAQKHIKLNGEATELVGFSAKANMIRATLQKRDDPEQGQLTLEFTDGPLNLVGFTSTDTAGNVTRIAMHDVAYGMPLEARLFAFEDPRGIAPRRSVRQ
jgi:outer membrane lipoprotein-sorting protein